MDLGLNGKNALVIGGSRGIGLAASIELAKEGANVFIVSRNQANIDHATDLIRENGGEASGHAADCLTSEGIASAIAAATAAYSAPDIVIYVPFVTIVGRFDDVSNEDFLAGDNALVIQFLNLVRGVLPHMKHERWGRILTVGSLCVRKIHREVPHTVPNTYRMAAVGLSKTLADEVAPFGITVNTIATGPIETESFREFYQMLADRENTSYEQVTREQTARVPVGRFGTPEEMAAVCTFLCSARSSFVTGQTILVDGGIVEAPL